MAVSSTSDGLPKLLEDLSIAVEKKSDDVTGVLDLIINKILESSADCSNHINCVQQLEILLEWKSKEIVSKAARLIAEISKCDAGREKCATQHVVQMLVNHLNVENQDLAVVTQACRALGNICFENDVGRQLIMEADCLPLLLKVIERSLKETTEGGRLLRSVSCGFLLNLLIGHEDIQKKAVDLNVVATLRKVLQLDGRKSEAEETANHVLLILGLLADSGSSGSSFMDEQLCRIIVEVLGTSTSPDLSEMCLELLHGQAEDETVKTYLARCGLCELLFRLLEKHKPLVEDDETRNLMKMACDLIVLIVTGDDSMNILYAEGKGKVFEEMVSWLSSDDEDLQITGVLAMGNFARTDKHCIQMVAAGVSQKLLALVAKNNTSAGDIRLQHALLSALRNLVIPSQNKATVLGNGLIDVVYPMLEIPTFPVVFKLLGTLRMSIDGQEKAACDLGRRKGLTGRLVTWCGTEDHPGVQGEANRLLAWLIKNSRDKEVLTVMVEGGAVKCLVTMLTAEHAVMQNEALLALTLLAAIRLDFAEPRLLEARIGVSIAKLLNDCGMKLEKEVILNVLSLIEQLAKSASMTRHLLDSGAISPLATLATRENIADIHDQIKRLKAQMESV